MASPPADPDDEMNNTAKNNESTAETPSEIIPGYSSIDEFTKDGFKILMEAIRNANSLPQDSNWEYHSVNPDFTRLMNKEGDDILRLINRIVKDEGVKGSVTNRDLDEKIELILETNDNIFERVGNHLDELNGLRKNPELPVEITTVSAKLPVNGSWNRIEKSAFTVSSNVQVERQRNVAAQPSIRLLTAKNITRPQEFFKDRIDNSNKFPWQPRISEKPNSLKPLAIYLEECDDGLGQTFCHPYEFELDRFEPSAEQLEAVKPALPKPISQTPLKMVATEAELNDLLEDLRHYKEIAVDLEHHSYRTFLGITCLMQISTPDTDYIVDTLTLRDKLWVLNEVFTKPSIVKIFHGAEQDVLWLQRDLSLYIVNMFDTYHASKQLEYPQLSLSYLLKKFCLVDANKHFQLADWRIRPLPNELIMYAREDTHYLIYIYQMMKNAILQQSNDSKVLKSVWQRSTAVCKKRYVKPALTEFSHMELYRKCKKLFDNRQMFALKALYAWRDDLARNEDESTGYILPNHMMLQIAEVLPREMQGVLACCNPIPPLVRSNLLEIHKLILKAREQPLVKPILSEETRSRGSTQQTTKFNMDSILYCPHDLLKSEEFRDDLPTLLNAKPDKRLSQLINKALPVESHDVSLSVFDSPESSDGEANEIKSKIRKLKFLGPFERYKLVKPYIQEEEEKERKELEKKKEAEAMQTRSDEDRISTLQSHFKTMASTIPQIKTDNYSEFEMTTLGTTDPHKRKRSDLDETSEPADQPDPCSKKAKTAECRPQLSKKAQKKLVKQLKREQRQLESGNAPEDQPTYRRQPKVKKGPKQKKNKPFNYAERQHSRPMNEQNNARNNQPNKQREPNRDAANWQHGNAEGGSAFDYGSVNYNQFQGGAGRVNQNRNIKSKFKNKGRNRNNGRQGGANHKSARLEGPKMPANRSSR